jgi:hypothetical protein
VIAAVIVIGSIGSALAGSHHKPGGGHTAAVASNSSPATSSPSTPTPTLSLSRAERRFVSDMRSTFNLTGDTTPGDIATIGDQVCSARGSGTSQSEAVSQVSGMMTTGASQVTKMAERDMCHKYLPPPPKPKVIARFNGEGIQNTAPFTVPASWHLSWEYWGCDGGSGNFIVDEDNTDGSPDFNGVSVNELGSGRGPVATDAYGDAGRHYFSVDSECSWSLAVVVGGH